MDAIIQHLNLATDSSVAVLANAWFQSACAEWRLIQSHVTTISNAQTTTQFVTL